ncbi:MAG: hypothetical protein SNJ84_03240 [Verrucomicrobiia bacterium]
MISTIFSLATFPLLATATAQTVSFADGPGLTLMESATTTLRIAPAIWGPNWAHSEVRGDLELSQGQARAALAGKIARTNAPFTLDVSLGRDATSARLDYTLQFPQATELTLFAIALHFDPSLDGARLQFVDGDARKEETLPLDQRGLGPSVSELTVLRDQGPPITLRFDPPVEIVSDKALRLVLAKDNVAEGFQKKQSIQMELAPETLFYAAPSEVPMPDNWDQWFAWQGTAQIPKDSALNMENWLDGPAGKYGRIQRDRDRLLRGGKPINFWGINLCFEANAPQKRIAERRAEVYAAHGINAVRLHKYADGHGWAGILSRESCIEFNPDQLDRMDYFIAKLKEKGIYSKLSPTFGTLKLGPQDRERVPYMDEFGSGERVTAPHGGAFLSKDLGDLHIEQMVRLLTHKNPYTGLTYAEDPAIMVVELLNEQSALFFTTMATLKNSPTLRRMAAEQFTEWLLQRYGSPEAVLERWGSGGLNTFAGEGFADESFAAKSVVPVGNPWFFDPDQLEGSQAFRKPRLLDTMLFLAELQNRYYARFIKAVRETGYTGEIVTSNWQAGRGFSHYYNLHSDTLGSIIDRHNYFNGPIPMLARPGSGMLSAGMQQVAGHPFMLSEWIHVFPTRFPSEGVAILAAYGMGLQGWDVSYIFQNRDEATFEPRLGTDRWVVAQPEVLGLFPAVARHVLRRDITPSDLQAVRHVHVPSLHQGKLGFDDQVRQGYDDKDFDSTTVPAEALAAVRVLVSFDEEYKETPTFDLTPFRKNGAIVSSTGQLSWHPAQARGDGGFFTIDTPATQAVVGFAAGRPHHLSQAIIETSTPYAAIYLTPADPDATLANARRLVLVALGRTLNDEMRFVGPRRLTNGSAPIKMEPVQATIRLQRPGTPTVHILDHDGKRTGQTLPIRDRSFTIDGASTQTPYYEITFP